MNRLWLVLPLAVAACQPGPPAGWSGYAEGDYVYIAAPIAGALTSLAVHKGERVGKGATLFALDAESETAARQEAQARVDAARAQASNQEKGKRRDEVAVIESQRAQAAANAQLARSELARITQLAAQNFVSASRVDDARAALEAAQARLAELDAALRVARLPARSDERAAAQAAVEAARETLRGLEWRERQKRLAAPADAIVAEQFFRVGEWVGAGQPVLALLPDGAVHARFFVAEAEIATLALGQKVALRCDGCGAPIEARIDFIASQAEYTPPVIYSNAQRARLVFRVEARPAPADAARLRPGQPLDVMRVS
jgi:HlyD family secretion protein